MIEETPTRPLIRNKHMMSTEQKLDRLLQLMEGDGKDAPGVVASRSEGLSGRLKAKARSLESRQK